MYYASAVYRRRLAFTANLLVRLANHFDAFFNPKNASETKGNTNKYLMFKANINSSTQQDYCTYEYDMVSLVLFEINSTHNSTQTNQPTTQP